MIARHPGSDEWTDVSTTSETLDGRVALVTGGASGIGLAIARELAARGAQVAIVDLDGSAAGTGAAELDGAVGLQWDVSDAAACEALAADVRRELGPVDRWRYLIDVMLIGPFVLTRAVLPDMHARRWGRIVNLGSIHSLIASPNKSAYIAAKHGLLGLTRATALEAGLHGVTVNAICPGWVRTPLVERQIADLAATEGIAVDEVTDRVVLGPAAVRRLIEPEEVARYAAFLCSDDAASITGSAQVIDGAGPPDRCGPMEVVEEANGRASNSERGAASMDLRHDESRPGS